MQSQSDQTRLLYNVSDGLSKVSDSASGAQPLVGEVRTFAGRDTSFDKWLLCDGSEVSRQQYPELADAVQDKFGVASDPSQFKLPHCTSKLVVAGVSGSTSSITGTAGADVLAETVSLGQVFICSS